MPPRAILILTMDDAERLLRISAFLGGGPSLAAVNRTNGWFESMAKAAREEQRRRRTRGLTALQLVAEREQRQHHNREHAGLADYRFQGDRALNTPMHRSKGLGAGRYKQRTEHEVIRIAFSSPSMPMKALAQTLRPPGSNRHCTDLLFTCDHLLIEKQACQIEVVCEAPELQFLVLQLTFDETLYRMMLSGKARHLNRATDLSLLGLAGRLLWAEGGPTYAIQEEEIVLHPVGMETNSAAAMWSGMQARLPKCLFDVLRGKSTCKLVAFCPSNDQHSANAMLLAHVDNEAGENIFTFPGWCRQHGTGNCLQPMLKRLNIISPEFCICRRLRNDGFQRRFLAGLKDGIAKNLVWKRHRDEPDWRPDPVHLKHARLILETAYFRKDLRNSEDT